MNNCLEESNKTEVIERQYLIKRYKRQKYSCKYCNKIITANGGPKLTPDGEYSIQLATQIACNKFEHHLPLKRQRKQMKRAFTREMIKGYEIRCIVSDGYSGYNFLESYKAYKDISHAFCWAHVRRKFFEAMNHEERSEVLLDLIDKLYEIESMAAEVHELKDIRLDNSVSIIK